MKAFKGGPLADVDFAALDAALRTAPELRNDVPKLARIIRRHPKTVRRMLLIEGPTPRAPPRKYPRDPAVAIDVRLVKNLLNRRCGNQKMFGTHAKLRAEFARRGAPLSRNQIRYRCVLAGVRGRIRPQTPTLDPKKLDATQKFARKTIPWAADPSNLRKTIWCDEWPAANDDKTQRSELCRDGEQPTKRVRKKRYAPNSLQAWVAIGWNWKEIVFSDNRTTRMNSRTYRENCLQKVLPRLRRGVFIQDNAKCHWGNCTWKTNPSAGPMPESNRAWLAKQGVETLELPPDSPQLNVCENLFSIMNASIAERAHLVTTQQEIREEMKRAFDGVDQGLIRRCILSWPDRLAVCAVDPTEAGSNHASGKKKRRREESVQ
jgi:hypothetical protein